MTSVAFTSSVKPAFLRDDVVGRRQQRCGVLALAQRVPALHHAAGADDLVIALVLVEAISSHGGA